MSPEYIELRTRIERELWAAIIELEAGSHQKAIKRASSAVAAAQAEGYVQLFRDAGRPAQRLMRMLERQDPTPYLQRLTRLNTPNRVMENSHAGDLSDRELEVVRYLPTSLSTAEIAEKLFVSQNTLKTHLRAIYRKLEVNNRRDAIQRAKTMGIA